ncbi:MAG: potassium channel family protein [Anaerolineae bacterium]|nr:potassium channel family protein [Anaerolineae bacterium]
MSKAKPALRETSIVYRVFISAATILALFVTAAYYLLPVPEEVRQVLYIMDSLNAFILLADFFYSTHHAPNRLRHSVTFGWLDLIGAIPGFPILRLLRIPSLIRTVRQLQRETASDLLKVARRELASSTLLSTILIVLLVVTVGSMAIVLLEKDAPNGNITTGEDAVWWSIVTIATVGYGDRFPTTPEGRLIGTAMIVVGVSLFSVLTSFIATSFVAHRQHEERGVDLETLRDELLRALSAREAAAERDTNALRGELAAMRPLLESAAAASGPPPGQPENGSAASRAAEEIGQTP